MIPGYISLYHPRAGLGRGFGLLLAILVLSVIVIPYLTVATEASLARVPGRRRYGAEVTLLAIGSPGAGAAVLLHAVGWSDTNPSAQMTNYLTRSITYPVFSFSHSVMHSPRILSCNAALISFVLVLLIIIAGQMIIIWSRHGAV